LVHSRDEFDPVRIFEFVRAHLPAGRSSLSTACWRSPPAGTARQIVLVAKIQFACRQLLTGSWLGSEPPARFAAPARRSGMELAMSFPRLPGERRRGSCRSPSPALPLAARPRRTRGRYGQWRDQRSLVPHSNPSVNRSQSTRP
jgi:hypothetical protein